MSDNGDTFDERCAKRKADLDQPVTAEWLDEQDGWTGSTNSVRTFIWKTDTSEEVSVEAWIYANRSQLFVYVCDRAEGGEFVTVATNPTRRQLLELVEALRKIGGGE